MNADESTSGSSGRQQRIGAVAELALFFAGAACACSGLRQGFGLPGVAIAAALATGLRVVADRCWTGRARLLVRALAVGGLLSLYGVWVYLAVVFGWLLAWTVSWPATGAILVVALVAVIGLRRPIVGMRIPPVLPLGVWIMVCLLGWLREETLVRCDDYSRFRSEGTSILAIPTTRALQECAPGDVLRVEYYPRKVWEAPDGSRYVVTMQRRSNPYVGTPVPDPIEHSICEFATDGSRRTCVGDETAQPIYESERLDRLFVAQFGGGNGTLYAFPRSDSLRLLDEARADAGIGEGYYDPDADEIALLADEGTGLTRFRASDLSPLPRLPVHFCPDEVHYDATRHEGIMCFAAGGPLGPLIFGTGDFLSVAFRGNPFSDRLLGTSHVLRYGAVVFGCNFDPVRRVAWLAIANLGVIAVTDYDSGQVIETWLAEPGLRSVAFDANRRRLYMSNFLRGEVTALDADSGRQINRWFVGRFARYLALTRDGNSLLVPSNLGVVRIPLAAASSPPGSKTQLP